MVARLTGSGSLARRLRRLRAERGSLRLGIELLIVALVAAQLVLWLLAREPASASLPLLAAVATLWSAQRFLQRPEPDRRFGLILAAGAALLWAQTLGLAPHPLGLIQGAS